jgi:hypothetical protein
LEAEVIALSVLAGAEVACARTKPGISRAALAASSAVLVNKPLLKSIMFRRLLAGEVPAFGDRYETGGKKVS